MSTHHFEISGLEDPITVPAASWVRVEDYSDVDFDYSGLSSGTATNATRIRNGYIEVQDQGFYIMAGHVRWEDTVTEQFKAAFSTRFVDNVGTVYKRTDNIFNNGQTWHNHTWIAYLEAGARIGQEVFQNSGVDQTVTAAEMRITLISHH